MTRPILLVEDAPNDIELALYALKKCGVPNDVIVARDGGEALDYLLCRGKYLSRGPGNPGLVLLDLKLPIVDGIQVLSTIRSSLGQCAGCAVPGWQTSLVHPTVANGAQRRHCLPRPPQRGASCKSTHCGY